MKNIDRPTLILAFVLAIFLWMYVRVSQESPATRRVIPKVPVEMVGTVSGIRTTLHPDNQTVNLTLKGNAEALDSVLPDEVKVKVDVSRIKTAGTTRLETAVKLPSNVQLYGKPPVVTILADVLDHEKFPVEVSFIVLPREGTAVGQYLAQPSDVTVEGTKDALGRVKYVTVSIDPNESISGGAKITPRAVDENGDRVDDVNVLEASVMLRLASGRAATGTRKVAVRVPDPVQPRKYLINVAKIRPDQVTLSGDPALLDRQSAYLETYPIDVSHLTKDTTLTVPLRIPSGITVVEGTTVRVDLEVQPVQP